MLSLKDLYLTVLEGIHPIGKIKLCLIGEPRSKMDRNSRTLPKMKNSKSFSHSWAKDRAKIITVPISTTIPIIKKTMQTPI